MHSLLSLKSFWFFLLSHVQLFTTPWTEAFQGPLSIGFPRQEYWSGLPFPSPGDLPDPGIKPVSLVSPALAGGFFTTSATWEAPFNVNLTAKGSGIKDNLVNLKHTYRKGISETSLAGQWLRP